MERISQHQFMILGAAVLLGTTFYPIAQIVIGVAGRDAWWSVLPAYGMAIPFGFMVLALSKKHPGLDLFQITEKLAGKWPTKGIVVIYSIITGYLGLLLLAQARDTFRRSILPLVPSLIIVCGLMLLVIMLIWSGIEVFARFTEITFPLVAGGLLFMILFSIPRFEAGEFFPIMADGIMSVVWGVLKLSPFAMEYVLVLGAILPHLPVGEEKRLRHGIVRAVLMVGVLSAALTLTEIMVFGPEETKRLNYGLLALGKMIEISKTLAGVESIFMLVWMGAEITKVSALFLVAVLGIRQITGWGKNIWLYLGVALIFIGIALIKPGGTSLGLEIDKLDGYLILPFTGLWVMLLVSLEWLQKKQMGRRKQA